MWKRLFWGDSESFVGMERAQGKKKDLSVGIGLFGLSDYTDYYLCPDSGRRPMNLAFLIAFANSL